MELPLFDSEQGQFFNGYRIIFGQQIRVSTADDEMSLTLELDTPALLSRLSAGKKQPLARACGLHKRKNLRILDCTAGLGQDSLTLAALGAQVQPLERNPAVHALLNEAISRENQNERLSSALANCLAPIRNNAANYLASSEAGDWDVIYLDPMFSGYKRKALPKKSMQLFAAICGDDNDADQLLPLALNKAKSRVVVKRANQAPFLDTKEPDLQVKGKSMRFDIYLKAQTG